MGLWDFAWWVYQEVNFSPRITQIALIFYFFSAIGHKTLWSLMFSVSLW